MDVSAVKRRIRYTLIHAERLMNQGYAFNSQRLLCEITECMMNLTRIQSQMSESNYVIVKQSLQELKDTLSSDSGNSFSYAADISAAAAGPGRPALMITQVQLKVLFSQGYTAKKMARHFQCSVSTVYKRCYEEKIKFRNRYTEISDHELRTIMISLLERFPNSGSIMMDGYLKSDGIVIQRKRVRKMLEEIDPLGTANRWSRTIKRRLYKVATPNSLWHMDAHMKLSRWGFATHGCIDGYSRSIIYVSCATSITAKTVVNLFIPAVRKYGIPSRVRSDHGFENLFVAILMNSIHGLERGSHITRRSVHNQRIERLWVDVFKQVINKYYNLFYKMEQDGVLNPDDIIQKYILQKIYLVKINEDLSKFKCAWNCHKIRTEGNSSPKELWVKGFLDNVNSNHTAINELINNQGPLLDRLNDIFEQQYGLNTTAISEDLNLNAESTESLNLTEEQTAHLNNILTSDDSDLNKYLSCTAFLQNFTDL